MRRLPSPSRAKAHISAWLTQYSAFSTAKPFLVQQNVGPDVFLVPNLVWISQQRLGSPARVPNLDLMRKRMNLKPPFCNLGGCFCEGASREMCQPQPPGTLTDATGTLPEIWGRGGPPKQRASRRIWFRNLVEMPVDKMSVHLAIMNW